MSAHKELVWNRASQLGLQERIHLPMQEPWVQFPSPGDLLEKETATQSCVLVWETPWTERRLIH